MHFCTVHVAIGGDQRNIMYRDPFAPVSWPEVEVLRTIHGDDAIGEIIPFVDVKQTPKAERDRLAMKYPEEILASIWGGRSAPTELKAPGVTQKADTVWMNPLSGLMEKTTATGSEPYTPPFEKRTAAEIVGNYAVREAASPDAAPENQMYSDDDYPEPIFEDAPPVPEEPKLTARKK